MNLSGGAVLTTNKYRMVWKNHDTLFGVVVILGLMLSLMLFFIVQHYEHQEIVSRFEREARERGDAVQLRYLHALEVLESFRLLYAIDIQRNEFDIFANSVLEAHPEFQALGWIVRVSAKARTVYEEALRDKFPQFQITERAVDGTMVRAGQRQEYFPIYHLKPYAGNESALGFDLASEPARRKALLQARDSGQISSTARIKLVQETEDQYGTLFILPLYRQSTSLFSVTQRQDRLFGFLSAVLRPKDLVEQALSYLSPGGIDIRLNDDSALEAERFLYFHASRLRQASVSGASDIMNKNRPELSLKIDFQVGGRSLSLLLTPSPGQYASIPSWRAWTLLLVGLIVTGAGAAYLQAMRKRTLRLVAVRHNLEQEIVERKRAEEALKQSEARLMTALESIDDGFVLYDADDRLVLCNSKYREIYKDSAEYIIPGARFEDIIRKGAEQGQYVEAVGRVDEWVAERLAYHRAANQVLEQPLSDGRWLQIADRRTRDGGYAGIRVDITKLKRTEATLSLTQMCVDHAAEGIFWVDEQARFCYVNHAACRNLGYSRAELLAMKAFDISPGMTEQIWPEFWQRCKHQGSLFFEALHRHKIGKQYPVEIAVNYLEHGGRVLMHAYVRDISERKRTEAHIYKLNQELEQRVKQRTSELRVAQQELLRKERLATLGQLTATVSHELRNPLGAMRPSMYIIRKRVNSNDPRLQQAVERVERNITRCDRIIDELLDFTRIQELDLQRIPIDEWLQTLLDGQFLPKELTLCWRLGLPGVSLCIDPDRLRRAVINLFENACQAMLPEVNFKPVPSDACLTVSTGIVPGRVELVFADTGPGISADVLPKIFEPLFSTKAFGVGLGLPTVKQIMVQHGGGLEVETREGHGTRMILWLPYED